MAEAFWSLTSNATFATLISILVTLFFAIKIYRRQKQLDFSIKVKEELISDIIHLQEKAHSALLIIDQIANSYIKTDRSDDSFFKESIKPEILKFSIIINVDIPTYLLRVGSKLGLFFENDKKLEECLIGFRKELKVWHDNLVFVKFDFRKKVQDQPQLSFDKVDALIQIFVKAVWNARFY